MMCVTCGRITKVLEARLQDNHIITRRTRQCEVGHKFKTYEVDDALWGTLEKYILGPHLKAVQKQQALTLRNEKVIAMLKAGEKHAVVANEFKLSENMVSTIARRNGIPSYAKIRGLL